MSNVMKLLTRTLLILLLMAVGAWLEKSLALPGNMAVIVNYAVYLIIGILLGGTANPRFTKPKNKWVYGIPILLFGVIGSLLLLYSLLHVAAWPFGIGNDLMEFSNLAWAIAGFFMSLAFR